MPAPRKVAIRVADVTPDVLAQLHAGDLETATLAEFLALDFAALLQSAVPKLPPAVLYRVREAAALGVVRRMELVGDVLRDHLKPEELPAFVAHRSDVVRGWACYAVGRAAGPTLAKRLAAIRPLAADPHFGVREWAWMAVRPHVAADLRRAVATLARWTADPSPFVRRFASEVLRPRGVWCGHIDELKRSPELGLPVLDPLRADPAKYVQDSVANWLNDAGKTRPDWVRTVCARWRAESPTPATERICKRAARNL